MLADTGRIPSVKTSNGVRLFERAVPERIARERKSSW